MNVFFLDSDPIKAAEYHNDKHCVKMIVETAQILSTVHHLLGSAQPQYYKQTHKNHPCVKWAAETTENYKWLCRLGLALCSEYTRRYNKQHKTQLLLSDLSCNVPHLSRNDFIAPPLAMPDQYRSNDAVRSYRNYYIGEKRHIAKWKSKVPEWYK